MLDGKWVRYASFVLAALGGACAIYLLVNGRTVDAALLAGLVLGAFAMLRWQESLPSLFTLLFTLVAAINGAGYAFDLWDVPVWFDEVVHVITPFVVVSAASWILIQRNAADPTENRLSYFAKVLLLGLVIGFAWEGFEYVATIIGDRRDTIIDLAMDAAGAVVAAAFCLWAARQPQTDLEPGKRRPPAPR